MLTQHLKRRNKGFFPSFGQQGVLGDGAGSMLHRLGACVEALKERVAYLAEMLLMGCSQIVWNLNQQGIFFRGRWEPRIPVRPIPQAFEFVTGESFCNRKKEQQDLIYYAKNSQNVLLYSHRRMGKTSLLHEVIHRLNKMKPKINSVYIDLYGTLDENDFINSILTSLT